MSPQEAWQATLGELQLQMNRATFNTWLKDARLTDVEEQTFTIAVRNDYARDWLENRLHATIQRTMASILGYRPELRFVASGATNGEARDDAPARPQHGALSGGESAEPAVGNGYGYPSTPLNPRYTFSTFVVGHNNRLAHAAALSVAERPGQTYNPLFIYGGVGLGKTHLLHAIGHKCASYGLSICYVSSETFTNDLIQAIRNQTTAQFREKYRSPDLLLIDDIQFIAGKESTQEELFHTFNDLHSRGKQVVLSSDRPPRAMVTLEERLRSRFEWGLMADIQLPDQETRLAILQNKAEELRADIPREVLESIARHVRNNIRELEGALNKVIAYARLYDRPITLDLANIALAELLRQPEKVTVERVVDVVSRYYNVGLPEMRGKGRTQAVAYPRQIAMYLCRSETDASFPQIGAYLGDRDHTTVMHGFDKIQARIEADANLRREIVEIKSLLYETPD